MQLDWLDSQPFTTLFVSGNHENYDRLDAYPVEEWNGGKIQHIRPSIIHLMRGQVYLIDGKKIFSFGGASSQDIRDGILELDDPLYKEKKKELDREYRSYRVNHLSWWERELPSAEEMKEGKMNLQERNNEVDFMVTHCCAPADSFFLLPSLLPKAVHAPTSLNDSLYRTGIPYPIPFSFLYITDPPAQEYHL